MQLPARTCKHLIVKTCAVLHVKCLECRMIGGVEHGSCRIREAVPYPPMPTGVKPPRKPRWDEFKEDSSEPGEPQRPPNRIVHETKGEVAKAGMDACARRQGGFYDGGGRV